MLFCLNIIDKSGRGETHKKLVDEHQKVVDEHRAYQKDCRVEI